MPISLDACAVVSSIIALGLFNINSATFSRPRSHPNGFDVNARCLDIGHQFLNITPFDGQNWEDNVESIRE